MFLPLAADHHAHLLLVHVHARVVVDNAKDARQVHVLKSLRRPDVHKLTPIIEGVVLAFVWDMEQVVLLLDRLNFADLLELSEQIEEDLLVKEEAKVQSRALGAHVERLAALQRSDVDRERVVDENLFDGDVLADDPLNVEKVVLIFLSKILRLLLFIIVIFVLFRRFSILHAFSVGEVKFDLVLGNLRSLAKDHAPDTLIYIKVLAQILGHVPLEHQLIVLLGEVLLHELVAASVDLGQLGHLLGLRLLRDRLVEIHLVQVPNEPVDVSDDGAGHEDGSNELEEKGLAGAVQAGGGALAPGCLDHKRPFVPSHL